MGSAEGLRPRLAIFLDEEVHLGAVKPDILRAPDEIEDFLELEAVGAHRELLEDDELLAGEARDFIVGKIWAGHRDSLVARARIDALDH